MMTFLRIHPLTISFDLSAIDWFAVTVAVAGYVTVFLSLLALYYVFNNLPRLISLNIRKKLRKQGRIKDAAQSDLHISGEVGAAISMALFFYFSEMHDKESEVITIRRTRKEYSPWSSRIYSLNPYYRKKL
ncbi:MAG: OadG family protein [Bacteroidales bacterium]|nr:OadG family protein [Bacteroidales bacterium]